MAVLLAFGVLFLTTLIMLPDFSPALLPELSIPRIRVTFIAREYDADKIERELIRAAREQFRRLRFLENMESKAVRGIGYLDLQYSYGADMNFALLELENKMDAWMSAMPAGLDRPLVHLSTVNDFPVFELAVLPKADGYKVDFSDWSEYVAPVIRRRIEQIPQVAFADMSGQEEYMLKVNIFPDKLKEKGCATSEVQNALRAMFKGEEIFPVEYGNYGLFVHLKSGSEDLSALQNLLVCEGVVLSDVASFSQTVIEETGKYRLNGGRGVVIRIYSKTGTSPLHLKKALRKLLEELSVDYPFLETRLLRDQALFLEQNIRSLLMSLFLGLVFATSVLFVFYKKPGLALLIGLTIPFSLLLSLAGYFLAGVTLNIFSLYGMIIGTGLVLDNGIIVVDNFLLKIREGKTCFDSCVSGTEELIGPIITSAGTTCIVFLPLIFQDGLSKELFFDQLLTIAIAMFCSVLVSCLLIPVLFFLFFSSANFKALPTRKTSMAMLPKGSSPGILYASLIFAGIWAFFHLDKSVFPRVTPEGLEFTVNWGAPFHEPFNDQLSLSVWEKIRGYSGDFSQHIGPAAFLMTESVKSESGKWQFFSGSDQEQASFSAGIKRLFFNSFPSAGLETKALGGLFEFVFNLTDIQYKTLRLRYSNRQAPEEKLRQFTAIMEDKGLAIPAFSWRDVGVWEFDFDQLEFHGIAESEVIDQISLIKDRYLTGIEGRQEPVGLSYGFNTLEKWRNSAGVRVSTGEEIPLTAISNLRWIRTPGEWYADKEGPFFPFLFRGKAAEDIEEIADLAVSTGFELAAHSPSQENEKITKSLWMIASSLVLLYLIMAILFNSLVQPLLALLVIPAGFSGAALVLFAAGAGLDIIAITGLIVTSGIVVNDAILKLDMIRRLRKTLPRMEAVATAGQMRFRAIVLTSLTTILSMLPSLAGQGLGAELQRPIALTITGGLFFGTLISIYFIPYLFKKIPWI